MDTSTTLIEENLEVEPVETQETIESVLNEALGIVPEGDTDSDTEGESPVTEAPEKGKEKAEVDYEQEVPMPDGTKVSIGALKDAYQQQAQQMANIIDRENEAKGHVEKASLLLSYVRDLPPEVAKAAARQATQDFANGIKELNKLIPETATEEGRIRIKTGVITLAQEYGLDDQWVSGITDPVAIKMLHDYARLKASIKEARNNVKPIKSNLKGQGKPSPTNSMDKLIQKAKSTRNPHDQANAIESLLRSNN